VALSIAPEKQTIDRGFTLKPSRLFSRTVFPQMLPAKFALLQDVEGGSAMRSPVFWFESGVVRAFAGKGPTVREVG
jgi:hypothetical protein